MIEINLPYTPTSNVQAAENKRFYNYLARDEKLLNNAESLDERGIN